MPYEKPPVLLGDDYFGYKPINISEVQKEVTQGTRPIYMSIISLTREDVIKTGYDNAES